ncbi:discoidin domain-containing protein [soil metagenome]
MVADSCGRLDPRHLARGRFGELAALAATALCALGCAMPLTAQTRVLDDFEPLAGWSAHPSDGVTLRITPDSGAMRLDFDFHGGAGYAIARKAVALELPENYRFAFRIRGEAPAENLEFKLIDPTGDNVWWTNRTGFHFPREWETLVTRKRQIDFAWGPRGGGELRRMAALELVVTAGSGGRGTVWIDSLTFTPLPPVTPYDLTPAASASTAAAAAARVLDHDSTTTWRAGDGKEWLALDFLKNREYGGVVLDWGPEYASAYEVQTSADGRAWETAYRVRAGNGGHDYIPLPETESRYLRLLLQDSGGGGYALRELNVQPLAFSKNANSLFEAVAKREPRGEYPRYLHDQQAYWTVVGVPGGEDEGLLDTDGRLETHRAGFSVEPFLYVGGRLIGWNDVATVPSLAGGYLPIPSVRWDSRPLALTVTTWAAGEAETAVLYARYRVENRSPRRQRGELFLALRPLQVNPPWQFLATQGGVAEGHAIGRRGGAVVVDSTALFPSRPPDAFGATTFDGGSVTDWLRRGAVPPSHGVEDAAGRASGALAYSLDLGPRETGEVTLAISFPAPARGGEADLAAAARGADSALAAAERRWRERLNRVLISLPDSELVQTLRSNLAYILINRDGPAIQPGSRSYARSWIRDGALTSAALLRLGHAEEVRDFIAWYAPFQYSSGKIPCCVDQRGADPVPENDSNGEFLYLVAEYGRFTGDTALLRRVWPQVGGAVAYLDSLRQQRLTPVYATPDSLPYRGLVPQSISHEGYSAKPMHSYWDDFWTLRGLKDAVWIAQALGEGEARRRFADLRDAFRRDLYASLERAMAVREIDFIPGAVELGDFDATSTTIAIAPGGELPNLPPAALGRTFDRYFAEFRERRDGAREWDAYTPYELRTVGTFARLGQPERAHELLDWFMRYRRPPAWNQWAEVVWRNADTAQFIGDMPHTWVGSDYIRSLLDMLAYTREDDSALVLGAGVTQDWLVGSGVAVRGLRTEYGALSYTMRREGEMVRVRVQGGVRVPPGGIVIRSPLARPIREVTVDGRTMGPATPREVRVERVPAEVVLRY